MKNTLLLSLTLLFVGFGTFSVTAQTASTSDNLVTQPIPDRTVNYNLADPGEAKPIIWGLDLAWLDSVNIIRGTRFMGTDIVDVVRSSFMPSDPIVNGELTGDALTNTNLRINIINRWLNPETQVVLNSDWPQLDPMFDPSNPDQAKNWAELIDVTRAMHEAAGRTVITVSPFNEPDDTPSWKTVIQGTIDDFKDIVDSLSNNSNFDNIRISGGNTLNTDSAMVWYDYLDPAGLEEGNTHQLAGDFDHYADFYTAVRANGDHATNDELHNVMEAMVGVEYGMQTGIWWGTAEYTRGEFCKASRPGGARLGYAEDRPNWTAASVYRAPDGKVQAFGGVSERQGVTTTYSFVSKDKAVFYDGYGPQRAYAVELPAGLPGTYQTDLHSNAECVINITWGEDIQPAIDGKYILVNRNSGKVMEAADGASSNGTNVQQNENNGATYQQWNVNPINKRNGGDFSYFNIKGVQSGKHLDISNTSLENEANAHLWERGAWWDGRQSLNQVWYLEYAGDGWFYIRNQFSAKCLEVADNGTAAGANIQQNEKNGAYNQQWRFLPIDATVDFTAPVAPTNLNATGNATSVKLEWTASSDEDVTSYDILRASSSGGEYNTIARNVDATSCVDNTTVAGVPYFYKIRAVDQSLNRSDYSDEVSATATGDDDLVLNLTFDGNTLDNTINLNHGAANGGTFVDGRVGSGAIALDGSTEFVQLPEDIASYPEISIATWVNRSGYTVSRHVFDFRTGDDEYMYLSPSVSGQMTFAIKYDGVEQILTAPMLPAAEWVHVVVTLGERGAAIYTNGQLVAETTEVTIRPSDFKPLMNYIGVNPTTRRLYNGQIDDFRIYNYELSPTQVSELYVTTDVFDLVMEDTDLSVWPVPADDILYIKYSEFSKSDYSTLQLFNMNGGVVMNIDFKSGKQTALDVSSLPTGIYLLRLTASEGIITKKIIIKH